MSGINYDLKKITSFAFDVDGVLSPSTIPMSDDGQPMRMVNIKDGFALQLAIKLGYNILIITGAKNESIIKRYKSLGINEIYIKASHKIELFNNWMHRYKLLPEEILYMGDDIPDIPCMNIAGLACSPEDGCHEVKKIANYISVIKGGYGCVRDVIEQVLKANGDWMKDDNAFGW